MPGKAKQAGRMLQVALFVVLLALDVCCQVYAHSSLMRP
jgi:hypothetical protein